MILSLAHSVAHISNCIIIGRRVLGGALSAALSITLGSPAFIQSAEATDLIPVEAFAALPNFSGAKLSPSGLSVAYFVEIEGKSNVIVQDLAGNERILIPPMDMGGIDNFYWANDDVILVKFGFAHDRWAYSRTTYQTRIVSFHRKTHKQVWLGRPKNVRRGSSLVEFTSQHERIVDMLPDDPEHILMQMDFELDGTPSVFKVNVKTGKRRDKKRGKRGIQTWITDANSEVRLGYGYYGKNRQARYKDPETGWQDLDKTDWFEDYTIEGFADKPDTLYVSGLSDAGKSGLYELNFRTGDVSDVVFAHDEVDIIDIVQHPLTGKLSGVAYVDDFYHVHYLDPDLQVVQRSLEHALPGHNISITSSARDRELYLVLMNSDQNPGHYYLYDRDAKRLDFVIAARPNMDPAKMARTKRVDIPVRDGTSIPGYLTEPNGVELKSLPTIVLPHGGPRSRDTAHWDYWAQFYANRGYLVLRPNFRGSTGYGPAFEAKGIKQWGGLMQDDVTDATRWLISAGYADPRRICIVGASYGGYSALMGVIKEQDLYACAVSVNGVTDLPRLKYEDIKFIGGRNWTEKMGLEGADDETVSPHDRAEEVSVPVILIASKDDMRIPYKFTRDTHRRLKKLGKESAYIEIEDGGHSLRTRSARLIMLSETEKFLAEHIGN